MKPWIIILVLSIYPDRASQVKRAISCVSIDAILGSVDVISD
jgi:hypothetical protein